MIPPDLLPRLLSGWVLTRAEREALAQHVARLEQEVGSLRMELAVLRRVCDPHHQRIPEKSIRKDTPRTGASYQE